VANKSSIATFSAFSINEFSEKAFTTISKSFDSSKRTIKCLVKSGVGNF